jgi:hypothetical protein
MIAMVVGLLTGYRVYQPVRSGLTKQNNWLVPFYDPLTSRL